MHDQKRPPRPAPRRAPSCSSRRAPGCAPSRPTWLVTPPRPCSTPSAVVLLVWPGTVQYTQPPDLRVTPLRPLAAPLLSARAPICSSRRRVPAPRRAPSCLTRRARRAVLLAARPGSSRHRVPAPRRTWSVLLVTSDTRAVHPAARPAYN